MSARIRQAVLVRALATAIAAAVVAWPPALQARAPSAPAAPVVARTGDHPGFGRVVFDFPAYTRFRMKRQGDHVVLQFDTAAPISAGGAPPRNMREITGGAGTAMLDLAPGAGVRTMRIGNRVIVDALDPSHARPTESRAASSTPPRGPQTAGTQAAGPLQAGAGAARPAAAAAPGAADKPQASPTARQSEPASAKPAEPAQAGGVAAAQANAAPAGGTPIPSPPTSPPPAPPVMIPADLVPASVPDMTSPVALSAARAVLPPGAPGQAMALPFAPETAAAAFRRAGQGLIVFDERRPIDLAAMHDDPVFHGGSIELLPDATVLHLPLPPGQEIGLIRIRSGWVVNVLPGRLTLHPIEPAMAGDDIRLPLAAPGAVVSLRDPETGATLLVGTARKPGDGVATLRQTPEFRLLPSWQGVVVEPISDRPVLRAEQGGFLLTASDPRGHGLAISPMTSATNALAEASALTRSFDFPPLSSDALIRRLQAEVSTAGAAPPPARLQPRKAAAEAMIGLGIDAEAEAVLRLAMTEDPRGAADAQAAGLSAVAAILAGRLDEAGAIDDPRLNGTDEIALWRAVRTAMLQEGAPDAAATFAATVPLVLAYPEALRARLLPLIAETMVLGGQTKAADVLLRSRKDDPTLVLARGLLAEATGDHKAALAVFDTLAQGRDRLDRARAARRAIELRLADGALSPTQAADAEEKLLYSWRGDRRELELRLRVAELRQRAGQWRQALAMLRETEAAFPEQRPAIHARLTDAFATMQRGDQANRMSPLDLVAMVQENPDLLPDGPGSEAIASTFADRLAALDLLQQADPVFTKLMHAATGAGARAEFGARLAQLRLEDGKAAGALDALAESQGEGLSPALVERRTLLFARASAAAGGTQKAIAALAGLASPAADEARASILEAAKDWSGAEAALGAYVAKAIPPSGPLDEGQARILLRLASAAAQAGDEAMLASLRQQDLARLPEGPSAAMFRMLTESPVRGVADLARSAKEAEAARALPQTIQALAANGAAK